MEKNWKELRNITTIDLAFQAKNILEKILWAIIGIIGTVWVFYFIGVQFKFWAQHPYLVTKGDFKLADITYPAITICSKGSTKYGIAERLGNYIDSSKVRVKDFPVNLLLLYAASTKEITDDGFDYSKDYKAPCLEGTWDVLRGVLGGAWELLGGV